MASPFCILLVVIWVSPATAVLSTLSLQTLNSVTFPSFSYRGAAGIYNRTLFAWNGYECNSTASACVTALVSKLLNTSDTLHTLDISSLVLTPTSATASSTNRRYLRRGSRTALWTPFSSTRWRTATTPSNDPPCTWAPPLRRTPSPRTMAGSCFLRAATSAPTWL